MPSSSSYSSLKRIAQSLSLPPKSLLALSPQNDPFYVGAPRQLEKGQWFARIYSAMGSPSKCHIRRVHYWLVTTNSVPKPNGQPYQNTNNDWGLLCLASKYARYLGLVPIDSIIDRRNPDPHINIQTWEHQSLSSIASTFDESSIIDQIVNSFWCFNPHLTQPYMLECWCEKSTVNDVLEPVCKQFGMNLVTGLGELSITSVYLLAQRIIESSKPTRIFYISDFDPAGECMPVSVGRKIEYFVSDLRAEGYEVDVKLIPLLLTSDQCVQYKLPRTPIKETEARKEGFETRHGVGATELDAMEALHPGEMRRIIEKAVSPYFDVDKWNEVVRRNQSIMSEVRAYLLGAECEACSGLGTVADEEGRFPHTSLICSSCSGTGKLPGRIGIDILSDLEIDPELETQPEPADPIDDESTSWLYDSGLEYGEQINRYRRHQKAGSRRGKDDDNLDELDSFDLDMDEFDEDEL